MPAVVVGKKKQIMPLCKKVAVFPNVASYGIHLYPVVNSRHWRSARVVACCRLWKRCGELRKCYATLAHVGCFLQDINHFSQSDLSIAVTIGLGICSGSQAGHDFHGIDGIGQVDFEVGGDIADR